MKNKKYYVFLEEQEIRILIKSLIRFKNNLVRQGSYSDVVDDVILKVIAANQK